jgi:hypothetical protein
MLWRFLTCLLLGVSLAAAAHESDDLRKQRLSALQPLVGAWRGVGQPQRGSTKDSWVEEASWSWSFAAQGPSLVAKLPKAKYFQALELVAADKDRSFTLLATPAGGGGPIRYSGQLDDHGQLVLVAESPPAAGPARVSFRFTAANDRLLLLLEKPGQTAGSFTRLAEVGYTRQGSGFGKVASGRECVVTGGLGTIEVTHAGKTYYVCCTGCRDYFNENPEKVLAEHIARQAKK